MAVTSPPLTAPTRPPGEARLRFPGWLGATLIIALLLFAGGIGAAIATQVTNRPVIQASGAAAIPNTVTVQGEGRVTAVPDTMWVDLGVDLQRGTVRDALTAASTEVTQMTTAVKAAGVAATDIQTLSISVYPRTDAAGGVTGYDAMNMVRVQIRDVNRANAIMGAAADATGNDARIGGIHYSSTDISAQASQARQAAITAASNRASDVARLAGRHLGQISAINEQFSGYLPAGQQVQGGGGGIGGAGTISPVQVGQGEVVVQVAVTYNLS